MSDASGTCDFIFHQEQTLAFICNFICIFNVVFFPPWTVPAKHGRHRCGGKTPAGKPGQCRYFLPSKEVVMLSCTERVVNTPRVLSATAQGDQKAEFHTPQPEDRTTLGPLWMQSHVL